MFLTMVILAAFSVLYTYTSSVLFPLPRGQKWGSNTFSSSHKHSFYPRPRWVIFGDECWHNTTSFTTTANDSLKPRKRVRTKPYRSVILHISTMPTSRDLAVALRGHPPRRDRARMGLRRAGDGRACDHRLPGGVDDECSRTVETHGGAPARRKALRSRSLSAWRILQWCDRHRSWPEKLSESISRRLPDGKVPSCSYGNSRSGYA